MSVTFWCPSAPTRVVTPYPDSEPAYTETQSLLPEINLANTNARAVIEMLGLDSPDLAGCVEVEHLDAVLSTISRVLANGLERATFLTPDEVNGQCVVDVETAVMADSLSVKNGGSRTLGELLNLKLAGVRRKGPMVYSMGRDDHYLLDAAERFRSLFTAAKNGSYAVCWG